MIAVIFVKLRNGRLGSGLYGSACLGLLLSSRPAQSQEPEEPPVVVVRSSAELLFDEALRHQDEGRPSEACTKFRESFAAEPSVGALFNVASCSQREGRILQARAELVRVLELNQRTQDAERKQRMDAAARQLTAELDARIGQVVPRVEPANVGAVLRLRDAEGPAPEPGAALSLAEGTYVFEASAPGFVPTVVPLRVKGGSKQELVLRLQPPKLEPPPNDDWLRAAIGAGSAGAGFAIAGAVLLGLAEGKAESLRAECGPEVAPPSCPAGSIERAQELSDAGAAFEAGGFTLVGVGAAGLGLSALFVALDALEPEAAAAVPTVSVASGEVRLSWHSAF